MNILIMVPVSIGGIGCRKERSSIFLANRDIDAGRLVGSSSVPRSYGCWIFRLAVFFMR